MMKLRFLDEPPPPPAEFAVAGLIPRSGLTLLVGAQSAGKSVLAAELAVAIVRGGPWAGREVQPAGSVLYIAPERGTVQERRLRHHLGSDERVAVAAGAFNLREAGSIEDLRRAVEEVERRSEERIGLVVIDTFAAAAPGIRENETAEVEPIARALARLSEEIDAPVILIHHAGKDGLIRGSTALPAAADAILAVRAGPNGARRLVQEKFNDGQPAAELQFRIVDGDGSPAVIWEDGAEPKARPASVENRLTPDEKLILAAVQNVRIRNPNATRADLRNAVLPALGTRSDSAKRTALSNGLKSLVRTGVIAPDDPFVSVRNASDPNVPNKPSGSAVSVSVRTAPFKGGVHALTRADTGESRSRRAERNRAGALP